MTTVYLHGGGDNAAARTMTFGVIAEALLAGRGPLLLVAAGIEASVELTYYHDLFTTLGAPTERLAQLAVSRAEPLTADSLAAHEPSGVFVCGGQTVVYHEALCADLSWVDYLRQRAVPYAGTSAGAVVAAAQAIIGGWQATADGAPRPILFSGAGEGFDALTVRPGAGLVPFAVDAHAGQMGTLTRAVHVVRAGYAAEAWAVDEDTVLAVEPARRRIFGRGYAYRVLQVGKGRVVVKAWAAPAEN